MNTIATPREVVTAASAEMLVDALAVYPFDVIAVFDDIHFRCPRCGVPGPNGGDAVLDRGGVYWHCSECRHDGTRYELERLVLEDARALRRLLMAVEP